MEKEKKEHDEERVKIYDKDMYINQEKLTTIAIIIIVFLIGFIAGYCSYNLSTRNVNGEMAQNTIYGNNI